MKGMGKYMRHFWKKTVLAAGLSGMMLTGAGCYYGGYGSYNSYSSKVKTTAASDILEDTLITDFQASDGTFKFKNLEWGSSYQDLEALINAPIGTTTAFTEGETMGDINYSIKLLDYITVGMQPVYDADGGLTCLTVYFEQTYTAEQLDEIYDKVLAAAREAFGDEDKLQDGEQVSGNTTYKTTAAFWYRETDQYDQYTMNSFQIGKLDTGNGTEAVVLGVNIYDPTQIEEESSEEGQETESAEISSEEDESQNDATSSETSESEDGE